MNFSPRPLLFIVGERAAPAYFSEDAYPEPKEFFVIPRALRRFVRQGKVHERIATKTG